MGAGAPEQLTQAGGWRWPEKVCCSSRVFPALPGGEGLCTFTLNSIRFAAGCFPTPRLVLFVAWGGRCRSLVNSLGTQCSKDTHRESSSGLSGGCQGPCKFTNNNHEAPQSKYALSSITQGASSFVFCSRIQQISSVHLPCARTALGGRAAPLGGDGCGCVSPCHTVPGRRLTCWWL